MSSIIQSIFAKLGITTHTLVIVASVAVGLATFITAITGDLPAGWQATAAIIAADLGLVAKAITSIVGKSKWEDSPVGQAHLANQVGIDPAVVMAAATGIHPDVGTDVDGGGQPADVDFPASADANVGSTVSASGPGGVSAPGATGAPPAS